MRLSAPLLALVAVVLAAYAPQTEGASTVPDARWENLQVLPDTISQDRLFGIMRGFTDALGVGCDHCHASRESGLGFASDTNPHKDVARDMMRMTWTLNAETLPAIEGLHGEGQLVTCYTCHRGAARPLTAPPDSTADAPEQGGHDHGDH